MSAAEPHPQVICGARELRADGRYECVRPPGHVGFACYMVRLNFGRRGA